MTTAPIYLDYNATAPMLPAVRSRMEEWFDAPLNPSSVHFYGRQAKKLIEDARKTLAERLSVWPNEIIFTGSGTEANNLALKGFGDVCMLVAATEHSSIYNTARTRGCSITLPVDGNGVIKLDELARQLQLCNKRPLVSVMLANNETGVIQPVAEVARVVHQYGGLLHCDAVQAIGKIPFDFGSLGVDMLTIAAHKIGGPVGVGALVLRNDLSLTPLLTGGGQEMKRRAGTENVLGIAGLGWAIEHAPALPDASRWQSEIEAAILAAAPNAHILGNAVSRIANTVCVTMPGVASETQLMNFDLAGICVSAGSACSSGRIEPSRVLQAMGLSEADSKSALRISFGWNTTQQEIERFIGEWIAIHHRLGAKLAA